MNNDSNDPKLEENKDEPEQAEENQEEKNKGGRPLKFQSVEELDKAIDQYFQSRDPYIAKTQRKVLKADGSIYWQDDEVLMPARPKTMSGLARALDCDRRTLLNYKDKPKFFPSISRALAQCQEYAEEQLFTPGLANGAKFALMNNHSDWADKSQTDLTSGGKELKGALVEFIGKDGSTDEQDKD